MGFWDNATVESDSGGDFWKDAVVSDPNAGLKKGQPKIPTAAQEALQPVEEDPIYEMQKHPYLTAAATGAAIGPTVGLGALGEIPGATAAAGAAEQMAYQKISDVGQKLAGPEHPILGAIPGIVAPMLSPALTAAGGGRTAAKAATEAELRVQAERQAQDVAEQKLAMTAPQAAALARPTNIDPKQAQQLSATKQALWQQRREALQTVGRQYDPIFQKVDEMPLTNGHIDSIKQGVDDARATIASRGRSFSPSTSKLLDEIAPEGTIKGKPLDTAESIRASEGETGPQPSASGLSFTESARAKHELSDNLFRIKGGDWYRPGVEQEKQTIGQLRGRLARLRQAADAPGISAVERSAIFDASKPIISVLDSVIPDEQKPILASINAQYSQVNKILPFKGMRAMNQAGTLPELGASMFAKENSPATSLVLGRMNDAQKGLMRDAFASYVLDKGGSGKELFNLLSTQKDNIARLGFPPELSSVGQWNELVTGANKMKTIPGLPAQKDFIKGVQEELKRSGYSKEALDAADDALRAEKLGMVGRRLGVYLPMTGLMGYGALAHDPYLWIPTAGFLAGYMGKRAVVNSSLLPLYRNAVMGGWTRGGGQAFAKMFVAQTRDAIQAANRPTVRPDKEREAEAMNP